MTGWRIGYAVGPADAIGAMTKIHQYTMLCAPITAQLAALEALKSGEPDVEEMVEQYDERRRLVVAGFRAMGLECFEPQGAFYCFPSVAGVLGRELRGRRPATSMELADLILEEAKVAIVPGEAFGAPGYARLSYALGDDDLVEGVTRIAKLVAEARPG
jgi:aspartate/methionine/tyrosine aminotransferase